MLHSSTNRTDFTKSIFIFRPQARFLLQIKSRPQRILGHIIEVPGSDVSPLMNRLSPRISTAEHQEEKDSTGGLKSPTAMSDKLTRVRVRGTLIKQLRRHNTDDCDYLR